MIFTTNESIASFGGKMLKLSHESPITDSKMQLNLYLPHQYFDPEHKEPLPVLLFLSGLTSTPDNISEKGYIEPYANKYGLAVLLPDTSPRLEDPKFKDGNGAGFYLDATTDPWSKHFKMYSYILKDLIPSIGKEFSKLNIQRMSICGHSMGGFGAIMIYLRNPNRFKSCSGFAPLTHPKGCFNGKKYFTQYLGPDESKWDQYDPCDLIKTFDGQKTPILIHQGKKDEFYIEKHLLPEEFLASSKGTKMDGLIDLRFVDDYDHSYYFVSTFVPEHFKFHAKHLDLI
ncbi:hypothetical protein HII13_005238 [Brettanomyces bruxellensis]|nr:hypothetical protein HII13_005238 [Brettanomyces bruxellensis]